MSPWKRNPKCRFVKNPPSIEILIDIGNTHTHIGWHDGQEWLRHVTLKTCKIKEGELSELQASWSGGEEPDWAAFCSVVPGASQVIRPWLSNQALKLGFHELSYEAVRGIEIDYPQPETIGADRLANSMAAAHLLGAPCIVVDFGTAVTFDVLNPFGAYVGGIIAPGIELMTDYFHERTALLPKIEIQDPNAVIGKSTVQAMQIGAVHGYRGMIRSLIQALKRDLKIDHLPVVATGGYAELITQTMPEITSVHPQLTLEGLRLLHPQRRS